MHRLSVLLLAAAVAVSLVFPAFASEDTNDELKTASQYLSSHGIMVGDEAGSMNFSSPLTRAQLATILTRIHGAYTQVEEQEAFYTARCRFLDVPEWAQKYVGYCAYHGLMIGYDENVFGAEDNVTPAAACTVILRYLALPDLEWNYTSACSTACDLGLCTPAMTQGLTLSRGNLAIMLYRTLTWSGSGNSEGALDPEAGTDYSDNLEIREEILTLVNQVRQKYGLPAAPADPLLMEAAQDYATRKNTWHDSEEECKLVLAHGYPHGFNCNLTVFTGVPLEKVAQTAVENWANSPGHLQAMIDHKADGLGVGVERYKGVTYCYLFVGMSGTINPYGD